MSSKAAIQFGVHAVRIASILSHPPPGHLSLHAQYFSTKSPNTPAIAHLEVERKFNVTPLLLSRLREADSKQKTQDDQATGSKFSRKSNTFINDAYYDCLDLLSSKGIWVRKRTELDIGGGMAFVGDPSRTTIATSTAKWEAKIRLGGDYSNSEFEEMTGEAEVRKAVEQYLSWNDLAQTVVLSTLRKTWTAIDVVSAEAGQATGEALVVVDKISSVITREETGKEMEYSYSIGELEITRDIDLSGEVEADQAKKAETTAKMGSQLEKWMERHGELFPTSPSPLGKLTAFYAWREKMRD